MLVIFHQMFRGVKILRWDQRWIGRFLDDETCSWLENMWSAGRPSPQRLSLKGLGETGNAEWRHSNNMWQRHAQTELRQRLIWTIDINNDPMVTSADRYGTSQVYMQRLRTQKGPLPQTPSNSATRIHHFDFHASGLYVDIKYKGLSHT